MRRILSCFILLGTVSMARAELTLFARQPSAAAAVAALNERPGHEKYVLSDTPLPSKYMVPRFRRMLNLGKIPKDAPLSRTSVAMIVDKTGTVVDAAAFNYNDTEFADLIVEAIPKMVAWVPNKTKKHERALIIFTYNSRAEDAEEIESGPAR